MGQYYYIPDPGEQRGGYNPPVPDRLAQLRQNQQFQNMQQPIQPQVMQPQPVQPPMTQQTSGMIWISGKAEADAYPIAPGNAVALWDSNNPVVYLRQADSTGKPSTKVYDLVERTDNPPTQQQTAPKADLSNYMTIDAAEEMIERRVNEILSERLKRPAKAAQKKEDADNG